MQYRVIHKLFPKALSSSNLFKATSDAFISQCVIHMARNPVRTVPGQVPRKAFRARILPNQGA